MPICCAVSLSNGHAPSTAMRASAHTSHWNHFTQCSLRFQVVEPFSLCHQSHCPSNSISNSLPCLLFGLRGCVCFVRRHSSQSEQCHSLTLPPQPSTTSLALPALSSNTQINRVIRLSTSSTLNMREPSQRSTTHFAQKMKISPNSLQQK